MGRHQYRIGHQHRDYYGRVTVPDQQQVDLKLRWEEGGVRRDQSRDTVEVGEASDEEALQEHLDPDSERFVEEDAEDEFEWDADREQALLDALEDAVEGSSPIVHRYIEMVMALS